MEFKEKQISYRISEYDKDAIDEIFRDFSRGIDVYFNVKPIETLDNKVILDYKGTLVKSISDEDFWKSYFIHYSLQEIKGNHFFEIAKVTDVSKKDNFATFSLSMPILWDKDITPEDIKEAENGAASIIRSAKSKAHAERRKILAKTEEDCAKMRADALHEIKEQREKLNNLSSRIDAYLSTIAKRDSMTKEEELHNMLNFLNLYQDEEDLILYKDEESFREKIKSLKSKIKWYQRESKKDPVFDMRIRLLDTPQKYECMLIKGRHEWAAKLADYFDDVAQLYAELRPKLGLKTSLTKVVDCYYGINELLEEYSMSLNKEYAALWDDLVKTCSSYDLFKRRKKEQQKAENEIERERIKAEKEYAKAIKQAEKDEVTARRKIEEAQKKLEEQKENEKKSNELKEHIARLEKALQDAIERGQRALSMAQQTKKGFVYIISNVNSFGKDVFKIGLTRRLDPTERIDELGNASVPFPFQIHAIIESEDAPALEAKLHRIFNEQKMNKKNWRKEFFKITAEDIQEVLKAEGIEASIVNDYSLFDYKTDFREV